MEKLSEIASVGINHRIRKEDVVQEGTYHLLYPQHLGENGNIDWDACGKIHGDNSNIKTIVEQGDIFVIIIGPKCGQFFKHTESRSFVTNSAFAVIKSKSDLFERIENKQAEIKSLSKGSLVSRIWRKDLMDLEV